jgi:hypothetical protein
MRGRPCHKWHQNVGSKMNQALCSQLLLLSMAPVWPRNLLTLIHELLLQVQWSALLTFSKLYCLYRPFSSQFPEVPPSSHSRDPSTVSPGQPGSSSGASSGGGRPPVAAVEAVQAVMRKVGKFKGRPW